jgi:hypothetical protein
MGSERQRPEAKAHLFQGYFVGLKPHASTQKQELTRPLAVVSAHPRDDGTVARVGHVRLGRGTADSLRE